MKYLQRDETNTWHERIIIALSMLRYGWLVNLFSGHIIISFFTPSCKVKSLKLLRHGKTVGVERNEFMSNTSSNAILSKDGIEEIKEASREVNNHMPDVILLAPLKRTMDTFRILQSQFTHDLPVIECTYMIGINNGVWEDKRLEALDEDNLYIFLQREYAHNIFVKSKDGDSWGDVFVRCSKLIHTVNREYKGKDILLISQGSIYQGIKILLHHSNKPWDGYSPNAMFSTKLCNEKSVGYGRVFRLF